MPLPFSRGAGSATGFGFTSQSKAGNPWPTLTITLESAETLPSGVTAGASIGWTISTYSNRYEIMQNALADGTTYLPPMASHSVTNNLAGLIPDTGRVFRCTPSLTGNLWIALQGGGGGGFTDGYGGTGGGGGGFVLLKLACTANSPFFLRVAPNGIACQGTWSSGAAYQNTSYHQIGGYCTTLLDANGSTIIARANGGQGGRKMPATDSAQVGGSGGTGEIITATKVLLSYVGTGGAGGASSNLNGREATSPGTPCSFDKTLPSKTFSNGTNGAYNSSGDFSNGTWLYGSRAYNSWQGFSNSVGQAGWNNANQVTEPGAFGDNGGGGAGKDSVGNTGYGSSGGRGYACIYPESQIS